MHEPILLIHIISQIEDAIQRIERRFKKIQKSDDFTDSEDGLDRLDSIAMMLIAIGENVKNLDKHSSGELLSRYPEIHWPGVKGVRDILAHDYFNIDPEEIFSICKDDLQPLKHVLLKMKEDLL
jgi:uncharacterized protein with HEPN domain